MTNHEIPQTGAQSQPVRSWLHRPILPIGLGTNTFGRTTDPAASHDVLDHFAVLGGSIIDTADTYSDGTAETILGEWLTPERRDKVVLCSKVGNHADFDGLSVAAITGGLEASLRRLGTDHIDLYYAHYQDDETALEESVLAFDRLVRAGTIGAVGLSNFDAPTVQRWIDLARSGGYAVPVALQPHYSLSHRHQYEGALRDVVANEGLALFPYRALGGGFLTGKYRSTADTEGPARGPGVRPLLTPAGLALLDVLDAIAESHLVRPSAVALAWLLRQPTVTVPLTSTTSPAQLDELVAAVGVGLTDAELTSLNAASADLSTD